MKFGQNLNYDLCYGHLCNKKGENRKVEINAITVEVSKLTLGPDDILVIRFPKEMSRFQIEGSLPKLRNAILDDVPILFFHGDVELTIVSRDGTSPAK